jgi:hypothetical protein
MQHRPQKRTLKPRISMDSLKLMLSKMLITTSGAYGSKLSIFANPKLSASELIPGLGPLYCS